MSQRISFEKIVADGQAMGYLDGRAVFATGPLPGEVADVTLARSKPTWASAACDHIVTPSPHRGAPQEAHYMSCSPWQGVDYGYQLELKRTMLAELFSRPELNLPVVEIVGSPAQFGYRNKLEFTVETDPYGELHLAFHQRGSYQNLVATPSGCVLGSEAMNKTAMAALDELRLLDLADFVDTITVRESQTDSGLLLIVLLRATVERDWRRLAHISGVTGIVVTHKDNHGQLGLAWSYGQPELTEDVMGTSISYPWNSFFQVNPAAFTMALEQILTYIQPGHAVADLYGGAGTIGLPAAARAKSVLGVELIPASVELANRNASANRLTNYEAIAVASERMEPGLLEDIDTVIVDPPRAGLHPRVVSYLQEARPEQIIYLSCNPITQVRDVLRLADGGYSIGRPTGFDFYPGTLHLESLVVLRRS